MEDNFYQASTERLIKPPRKQEEKVQREKIAYERERPLITTVMKALEEEIAQREKVDAIKNTNDPEAFMREVAINQQVCAVLRQKLGKIKRKVNMFDKKKLR